MKEEKELVTGGATPGTTGSRESRFQHGLKLNRWKWLAQVSPLVIALVAGAYWLGWYQGQNDSRYIQQALSDLTVEMMRSIRGSNHASEDPGGLSRLRAINLALKDELVKVGNRLLSRCKVESQSNLMAILESARQHCYPKPEEKYEEIIPDRVTRSYFILDGKTKSLAEVYWGSDKSLYEVSLERTSETGSFAGVCWEFEQPIDLSSKKTLEIEMVTSSEGNYEFKFEKKFFSQGQSNVVLQVDKIKQWTKVQIPLVKVDKDVLREMARFCIAIAESTSQSPISVAMEIKNGIVR